MTTLVFGDNLQNVHAISLNVWHDAFLNAYAGGKLNKIEGFTLKIFWMNT